MVDLGAGLRRALAKLTGAAMVDERAVKELVKEMQRTLITADVNVRLVFELTKRIEERALKEKPPAGMSVKEWVVKVVYDELVKLVGEKHEPKLRKQKILLLGLFGSGKTTQAAKIAHFFKSRGLSVGLVCADAARPAAFEQLQQLAQKVKADFYGEKGAKEAVGVAKRGLERMKEKDVVLIDSSGRSAFDAELARELKEINAAVMPDEKFLVVSADAGQVAGRQAEEFNRAVGVTGVVITKMDGSGKGGGAISAVAASGAPITFLGVGEKIDDLEVFDAKRFVGRLLGFPDLESLLERVKKVAEEEGLREEALEEKLTIKTFYEQLRAARKLGPLQSVFGMLGAPDVPKEILHQSEAKLKKYEVIINSMTPAEREDAGLLRKQKNRMERVARGAGASVEEVRELLTQFERVQKMMDAVRKNRGLRRRLEGLLKGGKLPGLPGFGM
ncbi:MAG: signal recognition particle receptor subunit alpha [Candidatus Micrarchaeia archaeon]